MWVPSISQSQSRVSAPISKRRKAPLFVRWECILNAGQRLSFQRKYRTSEDLVREIVDNFNGEDTTYIHQAAPHNDGRADVEVDIPMADWRPPTLKF